MIRCAHCTHRHPTVDLVRECADMQAEQDGLRYAEARMSWVMGGGSPDDASVYANAVVYGGGWDPGAHGGPVDDRECEHGLSAWLCAGPGHYPMDM